MCPNEVPQLPDGGYCMGNTCSAPLCLSIAPGKSPMHVSGWECAIQYGLDFLERLSCHPLAHYFIYHHVIWVGT